MIEEFTQWLSQTHPNAVFSDTTHLSTWLIIPVSQCIHIVSVVSVAIVMISVGVLNLNPLGIAGSRQSFGQLAKQLIFQHVIFKGVAKWDRSPMPPAAVRVAGSLSLAFWVSVLDCGRLIGFV